MYGCLGIYFGYVSVAVFQHIIVGGALGTLKTIKRPVSWVYVGITR